MNKKFLVEMCSDLDYEEMVADISYENHTVAMITQENGIDKMEIEVFSLQEAPSRKFLLDDFVNIIKFAQEKLIESKKQDGQ